MWEPLARLDNDPRYAANPALEALQQSAGIEPSDETWANETYQIVVRLMVPDGATEPPPNRAGMLHLSIHRHDREPIGDWRHMQQIKNEVAGAERTAVEVYPPESELLDTSNEYHLWVFPEGLDLPFAFKQGIVTDDEQVQAFNRANEEGRHKGRQRPWEPGLTVGRGPDAPILTGKARTIFDQLIGNTPKGD